MNKLQPLVFRAAIRQTQNAISLGSNGEGGILQFELPESEIASNLLADLMKLRKTELIITVLPAQAVSAAVAADTVAESDSTGEKAKAGASSKAPKGPFGQFWRHVDRTDLFSNPNLMEWLYRHRRVEGSPAADVVRAVFGVNSRTEISPDELLARLSQDLPEQALAGLRVTIGRLANVGA